MADRIRLFLTGSERAEYEHIYGPLTSDSADPRFVLVTEEEVDKIRALPPGVPPWRQQDWATVARIREAEAEAGEFELELLDLNAGPADVDAEDDSTEDVSVGGGQDEAVADSGTPISPDSPGADSNEPDPED